jgi:hypothetical protein
MPLRPLELVMRPIPLLGFIISAFEVDIFTTASVAWSDPQDLDEQAESLHRPLELCLA